MTDSELIDFYNRNNNTKVDMNTISLSDIITLHDLLRMVQLVQNGSIVL